MRASGLGLPSGRDIRRWTSRRSRYHRDAPLSDVLGDIYAAVFAVVMGSAMVFSLTSSLADHDVHRLKATSIGPDLDVTWLVILPVLAVTASLVGLACRLGPIALPAAQSAWWLPLPADRRTLLRPTAYRWPAVGALLGAVGAASIALVLGANASLLAVTTMLGSAITVALVVVAGLAQGWPSVQDKVRTAADTFIILTPVTAIALTFTGWVPPRLGGALIGAATFAVITAGALMLAWDQRLGDISGTSLRSRSAAIDEVLIAVLSLDTRGLGRALAVRDDLPRRQRSSALSWLARFPVRLRPLAALVTSDLLLFLRTPRHLVQIVISMCLPALALLVRRPSTDVVTATVLIGAYAAALATVEGARRAQANPAVDAALPLGQCQVRLARLVVPTVMMFLWSGPVFVLLAWRYADPAGWITLGLLAAPMWAAAAIRAAYRPPTDYSSALIYTPFGALPQGLTGAGAQGSDLAMLGGIPLIAALIVGAVPRQLYPLQFVMTLGAIVFVARPPSRT